MTQIAGLIDAFLAEYFTEFPLAATHAGADGYDDRLSDLSADAFARRARSEDAWLERFRALPDAELSADERIDRDLLISILRGDQIERRWAAWKRDPSSYLNQGLGGVFNLFLHRLHPEAELVANAAARMRAVPDVLAAGKENLDPDLAAPIFLQRAIGQCAAAIEYMRTMVPTEASTDRDRAVLTDAGETAARAYEDFLAFLEKLAPQARGSYAIGEEMYSALLQEKEMLGFGARELRERGRAQHAALSAEMSELARELRGTDDWRAVLRELNADHPATPDDMRVAYEDATERARAFCREHALVTLPEGERCLVEPSPPYQRPVLAVASYASPPAFKPSLTGHFFVPYPPDGTAPDEVRKRLETNSFHSIPTISVHEAYPGHHWHLITANQNPRPIRSVFGTPYFWEGWGLYSEVMMRQQGFFAERSHELCQVDARLFRAARIVVDTSLHMGEMDFEEAVRFMSTEASLSEPTARAEVGRYCAWPTQASSYLTGSLEIERMRDRWLAENRGDLRAFHDALAGSGALPIGLAERAVFG